MAKKKKAAKKPKTKGGVKPRAKKARAKTAAKKIVKKSPVKTRVVVTPGMMKVQLDPSLQERLTALGERMAVPLDKVLVMALSEFIDNWEDHMRTVTALNQGDDRMQVVAPKE